MSLQTKMVGAFLLVALASVGLVAIMTAWSTTRQFADYVFQREGEASIELLQQYYAEQGSWEGLGRRIWNSSQGASRMRGGAGSGPALTVLDLEGRVVLPGAGFQLNQVVAPELARQGMPIRVEGELVGTVLGPPRPVEYLSPAGLTFLLRARRVVLFSVLGAGVLALVGGFLLAGRMTRSLTELDQATRAVAEGELGRQVEVRSDDEVGQLARSFNRMSTDLAREESLRRQMTADIAHELRTPLSLILGHAEAMADEVLPRSDSNLRIVHDEARRLSRIVDDLRTLSLAETDELSLSLEPISLNQLAEQALAAREPEASAKSISLQLSLAPEDTTAKVDPDRVMQALGNLLDNALRHAPEGGEILLATEAEAGAIRLKVSNSGDSLRQEEISKIFQRFYRGDRARSRNDGGSGLGLAIAKSLVEAHSGRIWAESLEGGGARFVIEFPRKQPHRS